MRKYNFREKVSKLFVSPKDVTVESFSNHVAYQFLKAAVKAKAPVIEIESTSGLGTETAVKCFVQDSGFNFEKFYAGTYFEVQELNTPLKFIDSEMNTSDVSDTVLMVSRLDVLPEKMQEELKKILKNSGFKLVVYVSFKN